MITDSTKRKDAMYRLIVLLAVGFLLGGCVSGYTLVKADNIAVARGTMKVHPSIAWNKVPRTAFDVASEETWTQNGPLLDSITFIGGLSDGEAIAKQRKKDDRKVPVFRSSMTPQDLVSMVESYYRIRGQITVFETTEVKPVTFLGRPGVEFNFNYVGADDVKRRGRSFLAIVDSKLYFMALDATTLHYFDAALPEFVAIAASAKI
jgi:hypothetical protein